MQIVLMIDERPHYLSTVSYVPRIDELVKYEKQMYMVANVVYDLNQGEVNVYLVKTM